MPEINDVLKAGVLLHREGKLPEAWEKYQQVLEQNPRHAAALNAAGLLLRQAGQYEPAQEFLRRAIAIDPSDAAYHANLGETYRGLNQLPEALDCYLEAERLAPREPVIHYHMATLYQQSEMYAEAIASYQKAIALRVDAASYHGLGSVYLAQGKLDKADECFRAALEIDPTHPAAQRDLEITQQQVREP